MRRHGTRGKADFGNPHSQAAGPPSAARIVKARRALASEPPGQLGGFLPPAAKAGATNFCDLSSGSGAATPNKCCPCELPRRAPPCKTLTSDGAIFLPCRHTRAPSPSHGPHHHADWNRVDARAHYRRPAKTARILSFFKFRERIAMSCVFRQWRAAGVPCADTRVPPMIRKEFECRRNGILSLELAHRAASSADEARMLKLAQDWRDLANLIHRQSGQRVGKIGEHPLVRAKLGARDERAA
jgi:hypothetical protein